VLVWADIENDPQVQYLLPLVDACRRRGADTLVTARDYGATYELLAARGVNFVPVGSAYGRSKSAKVLGLAGRTLALLRLLRAGRRPDVLVSASRAATAAARALGIPSFVISDYEHANLTLFRWARATILHPDAIEQAAYLDAGFAPERVKAFRGLKEDLTFAGVSLADVEPAELGGARDNRVRVLVRPPAEESHYFHERSRTLYLDALSQLARRDDAVIVLAPRYDRQQADLEALAPANPPIVLTRPLPFLSLLRAVDVVLCSGGTMLREAAYLGLPAYSLFGSELGAVDRHLAAIGRAVLVSSPDQLAGIRLEHSAGFTPLAENPELASELASLLLGQA
jgi:uncharacterized protein